MEEMLAKAFANSAINTFKDMFALEAGAEPLRELGGDEDHGWDITGLIGLAGQAQGVMALRLTHVLLTKLLEASGIETGVASERKELESGLVGEITNIIAGHATSAIKGLNIEIAPPVVIRGAHHKIGWPAIAPVKQMCFNLPEGGFEIDLCIRIA
jgi:chemotaxis protein CheX